MDYLILIVCIAILVEVSLLLKQVFKPVRNSKRKVFIDTSALIDGRIINVAKTGFLDFDFVVLKSVLRELQLLADGKDSEKRNRARAGLDNVSELERVVEINLEIIDDNSYGTKVDDLLLEKAHEQNGLILTLDYNLIKVANAEHLDTLNLNDLALALKTDFKPGKRVKIRILEKGSGKGQGIGHLEDGAMVVVEHASGKVGKEVMVELERIHETSAGRMIFGKLIR